MSKSSRVSTEIFMFDDVNNNNINNNTIKTKKIQITARINRALVMSNDSSRNCRL